MIFRKIILEFSILKKKIKKIRHFKTFTVLEGSLSKMIFSRNRLRNIYFLFKKMIFKIVLDKTVLKIELSKMI